MAASIMGGVASAKLVVTFETGDKQEIDFPCLERFEARTDFHEWPGFSGYLECAPTGRQHISLFGLVKTKFIPNPITPVRRAAIRIANNLWKVSSLPGDCAPDGWADTVEQEIKGIPNG